MSILDIGWEGIARHPLFLPKLQSWLGRNITALGEASNSGSQFIFIFI